MSAISCTAFSQTAVKSNPIVFAEAFIGPSLGKAGEYQGGAAMNYQAGRHLFTFRYLYSQEDRLVGWFIIPFYEQVNELHETSVLYGWRFMESKVSYGFSLGISHSNFWELIEEGNQAARKTSRYIGVPFEANVHLFKAKKKPFRILGLIPVGRPTAFGGSIGLKLAGNISENSYVGLGLSYGLGWHKKY